MSVRAEKTTVEATYVVSRTCDRCGAETVTKVRPPFGAASLPRARVAIRRDGGMTALVYIAGPYSKPDPCENTFLAVQAADRLIDCCAPLIPHLSHFWHTMSPKPYESWLALDLHYLARCDALLRLPGDSSGADAEIDKAHEWGIPVFYDEDELRHFVTTGVG